MSTTPHARPDADPFDWDALARFLAGESSANEAEAIRRWMAERPEREEMVAALERALEKLPPPGAAGVDVEGALARVAARLDEPDVRPLTRRTRARRWWSAPMRVAAAVILAVGATSLWRAIAPGADDDGARSYATVPGERDSLRLPDGTGVVLGPGSAIALADGFGAASRELRLHGEAFFDVAHDARRPFIVRVGDVALRDAGTAFAASGDRTGVVHVTVTEGVVSVQPPRAPRSAAASLRAGDHAVVDATGRLTVARGAAAPEDTAWMHGRLVFRDAQLARVGEALERWYGVRLVVADSALAHRHLTASFDGEPAERVLDAVALALGARIERRGDSAIVRSAAGDTTR